MGGSFFTGLSGLNANAMGIRTVGNNLANSNTIGYKTTSVFFQELITSGAGKIVIGQGVTPGQTQQIFRQGSIQQSEVSTDMAIQGDGFFVVGDGVNAQFFTRAGNFQVNERGQLVTPEGMFVLGWPAVEGVVDLNTTLSPINVAPGQLLAPNPTSLVRFTVNLNSNTSVGNSFTTSTTVFDSLGEAHAVALTFTKTATGWDYEWSIPQSEIAGATTNPVVFATGSLTFDSSGKLTSPTSNVTGLTISNFANGADDLTFDWEIFGADGKVHLTQFELPSSTSDIFQDGNSAGTLSSIVIRRDGTVEGLFTNGEASPLGQIALATFTNVQGLIKQGANLFSRSSDSGEPNIGVPGTGGRGDIIGSALEMSNVEIPAEFIKLILFQRAYQANSRVITTADEITQETIQLKR